MKSKYDQWVFTAILSVCIVAPLSIDIFISGLPAIKEYFNGANVSLILSVALLGLALAQPIYGPLLDRFGRKPVLVAGLCIYTFAGVLVMCTSSFTLMMIGRFLQAAGACSTTVSVFAIARDRCDKDKLVYATSLIMAVIGISPIIAPLIGSFLNAFWGWRASFVFLFIMGCVYILLVQLYLKETLQNKNLQAFRIKEIINNYSGLAKTQGFVIYCLISGFSYSVLFSYLPLSTLFIIQQMHFSLISYGWIVATNAIAIISMATLAPRLANKITLLKTLFFGFLLITIGGFVMALINVSFKTNIYTFMLPMFLTTLGAGLIRPTASASAMQLAARPVAGSASAFFNFISFACGSIASSFSMKIISNVTGFGVFILAMGFTALVIIGFTFRSNLWSLAQTTSAAKDG